MHVGLLAEGVQPVQPRLSQAILGLIADTLREAWADLSARSPDVLRADHEPGITSLREGWLRSRLERLQPSVCAVARGSETVNHAGTRLEVRPDLVFSFPPVSGSTAHIYPLHVECKLLDRRSERRVSQYCADGLSRFVVGDYGWARQEGMMIAYVRDDARLPDTLADYLDGAPPTLYLTLSPPLMTGRDARTRHDRADVRHPQWRPGPIDIRHVWLICPAP
ncbi:MAG: hypothetical protein R3F43_09780 [bacterium]